MLGQYRCRPRNSSQCLLDLFHLPFVTPTCLAPSFFKNVPTGMRPGMSTVSLPPGLFQISHSRLRFAEMITSTSPVHGRPEVKCHLRALVCGCSEDHLKRDQNPVWTSCGHLLTCEFPAARPSGLQLTSLSSKYKRPTRYTVVPHADCKRSTTKRLEPPLLCH